MAPQTTILIVDDDPLILSGTADLLQQAGYRVLPAQTGERALELALEKVPDLVLLDIVLPGIDGLEACRRLKSDARTAGIPVLIASGRRIEPRDLAFGLELGADEYVVRPVDNLELLARVRALLRLRRAERELEAHRSRLEILVRERTAALEREVAERKRTEAALAKAKNEWEETFDAIADWVSIIDRDRTIVRTNAASETFAGRPPRETVGRRCCDVFQGADGPIPGCPAERALQSGRRESVERRLASGKWVRISVDPVGGGPPGKRRLVHVVRDITAAKKDEQDAIQSHKSEAFSILAGGIAHDYNNLLAVIWGNISLLRDDVCDAASREFFDAAERACAHAKLLTHQFITLSRGAVLNRSRHRVASILRAVLEETAATDALAVDLEIQDDLPPVEVDRDLLGIALQHLVTNAAEAMPGGGRLAIRAEAVPDDGEAQGGPRHLRLVFEDQGRGIPEADRHRVFDPYFSTKDPGSHRGMGMGLAVAQSVLRKHGGRLRIHSTVGRGTTVVATLPLENAGGEATKPEETVPRSGRPTVLIMEDDASIRRLLGQMLERLGCDVLCAGSAEQAVAAFRAARRGGGDIDLVLLVQNTTGGAGGAETLERLRRDGYGNRAVVVTGSPDTPIMARFRQHGFDGILLKPYSRADLERCIDRFVRRPATTLDHRRHQS